MTTAEMHVWFRQYAQQMGMQNVRAILPEQIDLLINTSITDYVNQLIRENVGVTNDRIVTDNSKIGQINALRKLYKVIEVNAKPRIMTVLPVDPGGTTVKPVNDTLEEDQENDDENLNQTPGTTEVPEVGGIIDKNPFLKKPETFIHRQTANIKDFKTGGTFDYLFLVDFSLNYHRDTPTEVTTNYFPVRLIDDAYLADTLNDFVLRPRLRTPIAVIYNDSIDLYVDVLKNGVLPENLQPNKLRVSYIATPAQVHYREDLGEPNEETDLPDYTHIDVLKHAVDLYRVAISGALLSTQQQEQAAAQENNRNNYRNEGYQPQQQQQR